MAQAKRSFILDRAKKRVEEIDRREAKAAAPSATRVQALAALRQEIPGVQVDFDAITGAPSNIMAAGRFLTTGKGATADPYAAVREFVTKYEALFGHGAAALEPGKSRVTREDITAHNGMRTVVWQQEVAGVPVFQTILKANLTKNGDLVTLGSHYLTDPVQAAGDQAALVARPPLDAGDALTTVATNLGGELQKAAVVATQAASSIGADKSQKLTAPGYSDTTAHLTWVPIDESTLRLAWQVETFSLQQNEMFRVLVDAEKGTVLVRQSITTDISNASYRVYAKPGFQPYDSPTPFSPGYSTPSSVQPAEVSRNLVTLDALNTTASPNGWIDDGGTQTLGNNVDAHTDTNADNVADLPRPTSATRNFDFTMDLTQAPSTYRDAAVTNLFYLCNYIHDVYYGLGFTESAGNFQTNNFGRGGLGNDAVQADAQDGSGTDNANFSTPSDGSPGRMQMYIFSNPSPQRDGDLDHEVVIHEYTHGLSNRLVGGGVGIYQNQTQGMGEGWSDFYALCLLSEASDDINGNYAAGGYATKNFFGLTENYYYGIRRYPYSTNLTKNPLTFRDIDPTQASAHAGIPRSSVIGSTADEVHNEGEVWCVTLWEMRANLVARYGWAVGNQLTLQLTTDAMKLCPVNPNMLQSRDAILQADLVDNGGANRNEIWAAFAKRGMGSSATSPSSSTTVGLVEAFDFPDDLGVTPFASTTASGVVGGPFTPAAQTFTLTNSGTSSLNWTAAKTQPWVTLSAASGTLAAGGSTTVVASFNAAASSLPPGSYTDTVSFSNTTSGAVLARSISLTVDPFTIPIFSEPFATPTLGAGWTITGTNSYRTQVTSSNSPHAGTYHLTMDSSVDDNYSRNEATLTLNMAGHHNVQLSFWARSYSDEGNGPPPSPFPGTGYDFDGVAISADGGINWYEVQPLRSLTDTYTKYVVDMDAVMASHGLTYGSNFKIRFNQYDNYGIATDGIAIDDIAVVETVNNLLSLSLPATASEGDAPVTATLSISPAQVADLTVSLASSAADATVPDSVLVPAGSTSVTFPVTILDDSLIDGTQPVLISANAATFGPAIKTLLVNDNETAVITLTLPSSVQEGSSPPEGTVSVSTPVDRDVTVTLVSDNVSAQVPASVTIPAGQTLALFTLLLPNDNLLNGSRTAAISASVPNWTPGSTTVTVLDDEAAAISLTLNTETNESAGVGTTVGTVTLGGIAVTPVTVALASSDITELTLPATVTIPAGQSSVLLSAEILDDTDLDGTQTVTVSASAFGNPPVTGTIPVRDNDAASFALSTVASPQRESAPFQFTITARDIDGLTLPAVAGPVTQTAANGSGPISYSYPAAEFVNGVWQQNVSVLPPAMNVVITVTGPQATAQSNAFNVLPGPHLGVAPASFTLDIPRQSSKTRTLTLSNNGQGTMTWNASGSQTWLTCAPASGTVEEGQSAMVSVTFNAASLSEGTTTAQLNITSNDYTNPTVGVPVTLNVTAPVASFSWDAVPSPQRVNSPFPVTVTAKDSSGGTMTNYEGPAGLSAFTGVAGPATVKVVSFVGYADTAQEYPNTKTAISRYFTDYVETSFSSTTVSALTTALAGQHVLLIPEQENSTFSQMQALGTAWSSTLNTFVSQGGTVIVCSYGVNEEQILVQSGLLTVTKMTSPEFTTLENVTSTFLNAGITPPITHEWMSTYSATTNGVVSIREVSTGYPVVVHRNVDLGKVILIGTDYFTTNTSMDRVVANAVAASGPQNIPQPLTPVKTGTFVNGAWSGDVTAGLPFTSGRLRATQGSATGDSNAFDVTADGTLSISLAGPSVGENAGTFGGTVTVSPAPAADVVLTLSSSVATAAVPASASVTIPAGSTSAPFTLNIIDDAILDGPQTTQIGAVGIGYAAVSTPLDVNDDEGATLTINLSSDTYAEDAGTISGTITSSAAPANAITVQLASSDTTEATVPASVTLPAGATSVPFSLTVVDDPLVDGPQTTVLSATVGGWTSGTNTLTITDNEARTLTINGVPTSISEGAATLTTSTISLAGQTAEDLVVTLTSSDTTALPTLSVTIPAGASSAAFDLDPVDDLLLDGTQHVTLTASAATFTSGSADIDVLDDDVHHFILSTVPGSQNEGIAFAFTATAKDVNDVTITTAVGGPVNLTAAGDGGAINVLPAVLAPFTNGVWTGNVRVMGPGTNVKLTVASPTATTLSNAFDVAAGPRLSASPSSFALSIAQNTSKTRTLTLSNPGVSPLTWSLSPSYAVSVASGREFVGLTMPISKEEADSRPATSWSEPRTPEAAAVSSLGFGRGLDDCLAQINARYAEITALIPNRYDFSDGVTGNYISDGGNDMYDGGNYLNTNLGTSISYSDNVILSPATSLGAGGRYFTRKQPGLFVFAADVAGLSTFGITGNLGADSGGSMDAAVLTASRSGVNYKGFVKRVYNAGDPSVNHIIIVADNGSVAHTYATDTNDDQHTVTGLTGVTRVYYLLYAGQSGGYINDAQTTAIFTKFLDIAEQANWLTATPTSGTIAPGGSTPLQVGFNASGLQPGVYQAGLQINSNDGLQPQQTIPVAMTVTPGLHHFDWDSISSPLVVNAPATVTVRAKDSANNPVTDFAGTAALTAMNTSAASETTVGTGISSTYYILDTSYQVHRTQSIYTAAEAGSAGRLTGLALDVATLGSPTTSTFTVRLKHTTRANYSSDTSWEGSGWTVVYTGSKTLATGLNYFTFTNPFDYDGSSNLMVDISFASASYSSASYCKYTTSAAARTIYNGAYSGDPLTWSGSSTYAYTSTAQPNLRLVKSSAPALITPVNTGAFVSGVWSGDIRLGSVGSIAVTATSGSATGTSNTVTTTSSGQTLSLTLPASVAEGQGVLSGTGRVTVSSAPGSALTVSLESLDTSEITLPATVTLPAGQTTVTFDVTVVDDAVLDGPQTVQCRALATGYPTATSTSTVTDNDSTTVTVTLPATVTEGATAQGTVQFASPTAADLTVTLASSLTARATVPASVVIPAGQSSAAFTITAPDNSIIDGTQIATITATLAGSTPGTATIQVLDNESTNLTISLFYSSISEGAAPQTSAGYVYLSGSVTSPLTINLASNDTTELTVPATVTIPAGSSSSNYFTLTPVNDNLKDGSQIVALTATAAGFTSSSQNITVLDDDVDHFAMTTIPSPQVRNGAFNVTFTAKDVNNVTITTYAGTPTLSAADGGSSLPITPATLSGFSSGVKTQSLSIGSYATSAIVSVTDSVAGSTSSSNAFAVSYGTMSQFGWSAIGTQQSPGVPFSTTVTAQDAQGNTVPTFTGTASVQGITTASESTIGTGTVSAGKPFDTSYDGTRTQMIFLPSEIGGAGLLTGIKFNISVLPGLPMSRFAIRVKHTATASYPSSTNFDNTGLVTVYSSPSESVATTGLKTFNFITPFSYDGVQNLLVDVVFDNASSAAAGYCLGTTTASARVLYGSNQRSWGYGDPYTWTYANNFTTTQLPNVKLVFGTTIAVTPATTGAFTGGVWSGSLTVPTAVSSIRLQASAGSISGMSNFFSTSPPTLSISLPASAVESASTVSGTVSLNVPQASATTVSLSSNDTTEAQPAASTVTIPAGSTSAAFTLNIINDSLRDGSQNATITASAGGMTSGTATITVTDDDVDNFLVSAVSSQVRAAAFSVTFTARDVNNVTIPTYSGTPTLTALDGVTPLTISPTSMSGFSSGTKTQSIIISSFATNAVITATDATTGGKGSSNPFVVSYGPLDHFSISSVSSVLANGIAQPVTITAQDAFNNTLSSFNQTANLAISSDPTFNTSGTSTTVWSIPLGSQSRTQRMQVIYLPSEVGATARNLNNLALYVSTVPGSTLSNFTIRMKHSALTSYSTASWDSSGWTTVYQGNPAISSTGWKQFDFTTPFAYNGTSSLMVDYSYYNSATGTVQGYVQYTTASATRTVLLQTDTDYASPLTWTGTTNPTPASNAVVPNARFGSSSFALPVTPTVTGSFTNGVWTGSFTPGSTTASSVKFRASSGVAAGATGNFTVSTPALGVTLPASVSENGATVSGTVTVSFALPSALTVNLASNDTTEAQPATSTVTIPAGSTSASFTLNIVNDTLRDGTQSATITASAANTTSGGATISVTDDDVDNFLVSAVGTQVRYAPFGVTFTARDVNNVVITNYSGAPVLTAVDGATSLTVSPTTVSSFSGGTRSQSVTVSSFATNAVLTLTDPVTGGKGSSSTFAVTYGTAVQFGWSTITQPTAGVPFSTTVSALDIYGNTVGSFTGNAGVTAMKATKTGTGASSWSYPLSHTGFSNRAQTICTAAELGAAKVFQSLSLNVISLGSSANTGVLTIRMKHTSKSDYTASALFETTGWTTCYQGPTAAFAGMNTFTFTTPFTYDGAQNVLVDMCLTTGVIPATAMTSATDAGAPLSVYANALSGDPLQWSYAGTTTNLRPDFILGSDPGFTPTPSITGAFVSGVWTGSFTVPYTSSVLLKAQSGTTLGLSNIFNPLSPSPLTLSLPASAVESAGSVSGTVSIPVSQATDTLVSLSSNDTTEAQPALATVTIPAGSTSAAFTLNIINDSLTDGLQTATVTASASGFGNGTAPINVFDDDLKYLSLTTLSGSGVAGTSFPLTASARTIDGYPATAVDGTSAALACTVGGTANTITPGSTGTFSGGLWSGNVTIGSAGVAVITATSGSVTGTSGEFPLNAVGAGTSSQFVITGLTSGSQINSGTSQSITVRAVNATGTTDNTYNGTADISVSAPGLGQVLVGDGATTSVFPFYGGNHDTRTQVIYTAAQLGGRPISLSGLALNIANSGGAYSTYTIRLKHTTKASFSGTFAWETGWVTVYQGTTTPIVGWNTYTFSTPFDYNGTDNLMVDLSFDNSNIFSTANARHTSADAIMMTSGGANSTNGTPVSWDGGTTPVVAGSYSQPQLRLLVNGGIAVSPGQTGSFTGGVWSGSVTLQGAAKDVSLTISDRSGRSGTVGGLVLAPAAPSMNSEPFFTGGTSNTLSWPPVSGALSYDIQGTNNPINFTTLAINQSTTGTSATATALGNYVQYWYRLRYQRSVTFGDSTWSQTRWGDFAADALSGVSADTVAGSVTLAPTATSPSAVVEDFNASGVTWSNLFTVQGGTSGYAFARSALTAGPNTSPELPINQNGDMEGRVSGAYAWCLAADTPANNFYDGSIDAYLCPETPAAAMSGALILRGGVVNGAPVGYQALVTYNSATSATISIAYTGVGNIAAFPSVTVSASDIIRLTFSASGPRLVLNAWKVGVSGGSVVETPILNGGSASLVAYDSHHTSGRAGLRTLNGSSAMLFDSITITRETPVYSFNTGTITSGTLSPAVRQLWGRLNYGATLPAGTALSVSVLDSGSNVLAANVASGTDLNTLPAVASASAIMLRASLSTSDSSATPQLNDWSVDYTAAPGQTVTSAWSGTVSSVQDATPPDVTALVTTISGTTGTLRGTAFDAGSGIASMTVAGTPVTGSFSSWSSPLSGLQDGPNTITITATDSVVPANTATITTTVYQITNPVQDTNNDGISSLMEHAMGIPAGTANPRSMLPATTLQTDGTTGDKYLTMQFRRRIQRTGLSYTVETSSNLATWDKTGANVQVMSSTPTGDGVTENVTIRVTPAMSTSNPSKFVRLTVTTN
ncbi:M36 family metallopeptidase [Prosthecobacter sp.]|uniref:M36 family metallopeptidase n=1 Tax=Prosthecobacter sp. TaxID=1965333 RepID=UPI00378483F7